MTHPLRIACATLAVVACASSQPRQPPESGATSDQAEQRPLVGRLQLHDRVLDLTIDAFGSGPNAVPSQSFANIMADVVVTKPEPARDRDRDEATRPGLRSPLH